MRLEVLTPARRVLDCQVRRIRAEAPGGHFGILPRHADFVTQLVTGILVYTPLDGDDRFVALNAGTLVKCGEHIRVAVGGAIVDHNLARLRSLVSYQFRREGELERDSRAALARLEASMVRRFHELEGSGR